MHSSIFVLVPDSGMHWAIRNAELRGSGRIQIVNMVLTEEVLSELFCLCTFFGVSVHMYVSICMCIPFGQNDICLSSFADVLLLWSVSMSSVSGGQDSMVTSWHLSTMGPNALSQQMSSCSDNLLSD